MEHEVVKIFTAQDTIEAEMILSSLKENDIPAYKKDLGSAGIMNLYVSNSRSGEDIFVADVDADKATEVLEGMGLL